MYSLFTEKKDLVELVIRQNCLENGLTPPPPPASSSSTTTGEFLVKVKFFHKISTTFEFSRQKDDTKLLENNIFQSVSNLKQLIFDIFQ